MFNRFTRQAREVVTSAEQQARLRGDATIESEHLLLALDVPTLSKEEIEAALDAEEERALAAVGVSRAEFDLPRRQPLASRPRFGASAKRALEGALIAAQGRDDKRIAPQHVLLGVLRSDEGRVARALRVAGIDRAALARTVGDTI